MNIYMRVDGIVCEHCKRRIAAALKEDPAISTVKIKNGIAKLKCSRTPDIDCCIKRICDMGYETRPDWVSEKRSQIQKNVTLWQFFFILAALLLAALGINKAFGYNIFNVIPQIDSSLTYGMLVVTGLFTSIHCVSMCGAINLTASSRSSSGKIPVPILYNFGRLLSYTATGAVAGAVGEALNMSSTAQGIVITVAALFMLLMALKMLGVLDFYTPSCMMHLQKGQSAFVIGLLNGLMPCGPLQAMQLYAAGTGSVASGAVSMLLFGIGTVPLMLGMGLLLRLKRSRWQKWITRVASVMILVLSVVMLNRGLSTLNIRIPIFADTANETDGYMTAVLEDDVQVIEGELGYNSYGDYVVQEGIPVRWILHVDEDYLTGCNEELLVSAFDLDIKLSAGDNIIEFTPDEAGSYTVSCWMHMISNTIIVKDKL